MSYEEDAGGVYRFDDRNVHVLLAVMTCASKVPASVSTAFVCYV